MFSHPADGISRNSTPKSLDLRDQSVVMIETTSPCSKENTPSAVRIPPHDLHMVLSVALQANPQAYLVAFRRYPTSGNECSLYGPEYFEKSNSLYQGRD